MKPRGFTLLETLLALMVFSLAVVALVEALHQLGNTTLLRRREATVQERIRSLLIEHTRRPDSPEEAKFKDGDVSYTVRRKPLQLTNKDSQPLPDMFEVSATAEWKEGNLLQTITTETWVYPPLYRPPGT